jgi:hypothetical protein
MFGDIWRSDYFNEYALQAITDQRVCTYCLGEQVQLLLLYVEIQVCQLEF